MKLQFWLPIPPGYLKNSPQTSKKKSHQFFEIFFLKNSPQILITKFTSNFLIFSQKFNLRYLFFSSFHIKVGEYLIKNIRTKGRLIPPTFYNDNKRWKSWNVHTFSLSTKSILFFLELNFAFILLMVSSFLSYQPLWEQW